MPEVETGTTSSLVNKQQKLTAIEPLLKKIRQTHGSDLQAIIVYGSWLRGKTDTMLDFYVLTDSNASLPTIWQRFLCHALPPNVYQIHATSAAAEDGTHVMRAKYALLTLKQFCRAMKHDFHSYFWARFAQPCEIVFTRDDDALRLLQTAFEDAATTFMRRTLPLLPENYSSRELWVTGLQQTYRCELRTESGQRADTLYEFDPDYYDQKTRTFAAALAAGSGERRWASFSWWIRRLQGKLLSVLRLLKAAFTFNEPLQYLLWKVERHTGLQFQASERQFKHPLLFAWPLLWRMYRQGAFR
jgi:hypothetical protein